MDFFQLLFDAFAFHHLLLFAFAGLVFVLIGAALLYEHKLWSRSARRVQGTIKALRESVRDDEDKTIIYFPIITYTGADGKSVEAECDMGSSEFIFLVPGKTVDAYIHPSSPHKFRVKGDVSQAVGYFLMLIGAIVFYSAVRSMELSVMTIVASALFLIWGVLKIRKKITAVTIWSDPHGLAVKAKNSLSGTHETSRIMNKEDVLQAIRKRDNSFMQSFPLILLIMLVFVAFGAYCVLAGMGYFTENPLEDLGELAPLLAWGILVLGLMAVSGLFAELGKARTRQTRF